jgi:hypothetical protein
MVSKRYLSAVGEPLCLKVIFDNDVISVNVTGDGACGPGGGGFFGISPTLYERPVRGVGEGEGCWAQTAPQDKNAANVNADMNWICDLAFI